MEPREEADEMTKKREDADDDISSLWGFSGEVRCSSLSMLAFTAGLVGFYRRVSWLLPQG